MIGFIYNFPLPVICVTLLICGTLIAVTLTRDFELDARIASFRVKNAPETVSRDLLKELRSEAYLLPTNYVAKTPKPTPLPTTRFTSTTRAAVTTTTTTNVPTPSGPPVPVHTSKPTELLDYMSECWILYELVDGGEDIFTPNSIEYIRKFETALRSAPHFDEHARRSEVTFVFNRSGITDLPPAKHYWTSRFVSAMNYFYPTIDASVERQYSLYNVVDFDGRGGAMYSIGDVKQLIAYAIDDLGVFVDKTFNMWKRRSRLLRTRIEWGYTAVVGEQHEPVRNAARDELLSWLKQVTLHVVCLFVCLFVVCLTTYVRRSHRF
jgi:hypothetical protein